MLGPALVASRVRSAWRRKVEGRWVGGQGWRCEIYVSATGQMRGRGEVTGGAANDNKARGDEEMRCLTLLHAAASLGWAWAASRVRAVRRGWSFDAADARPPARACDHRRLAQAHSQVPSMPLKSSGELPHAREGEDARNTSTPHAPTGTFAAPLPCLRPPARPSIHAAAEMRTGEGNGTDLPLRSMASWTAFW